MRHLIFSIVGSPPESPSVNPPGAGTIGFETEYQVGHNAPPDILIGMPASLLLLACSPRPGVARQHERFPENDSPWLHLKSEPAERPIQRLRPVAHERRQWERRELRPVFGITERPSPTLAVAVHEIIPLDGAAMGTDAGQVLASHRLRILRTHAPIHVEQASERLGQQSGLVHPALGDDTATVSVPSCEFQEQAGLYGLVSALPAGHRPHAAYQGHLVERPYLRSVVRARHQPRHRLPRVHRPYLHAHDPFPFLHGSFTDDIIPSISFASPTAVRNIRCGIIPHLIFPVVGSFFSLSLRSPMVMIRFPGVVLLLGFF